MDSVLNAIVQCLNDQGNAAVRWSDENVCEFEVDMKAFYIQYRNYTKRTLPDGSVHNSTAKDESIRGYIAACVMAGHLIQIDGGHGRHRKYRLIDTEGKTFGLGDAVQALVRRIEEIKRGG